MLSFYAICAVAGGALVLLSSLLGHGHDGDFDHDHDHDHGMDHADVWIPFFSLRFWTYAIAFFGVTGVALSLWTSVPSSTISVASVATGLLSGLAVSFAMFLLRRNDSDSTASETDLVGSTAKVLVPVSKEQAGKVRVELRGETIDLLAETLDDTTLTIGSSALIVGFEKQRARVTSI